MPEVYRGPSTITLVGFDVSIDENGFLVYTTKKTPVDELKKALNEFMSDHPDLEEYLKIVEFCNDEVDIITKELEEHEDDTVSVGGQVLAKSPEDRDVLGVEGLDPV